MQINFGVATGINGIPTAITIQKGKVQDKKHMEQMLKIVLHKEKGKKNLKEKRREETKLLKKRKKERIPCIQKTIVDLKNPYITGIEGFFILESSCRCFRQAKY